MKGIALALVVLIAACGDDHQRPPDAASADAAVTDAAPTADAPGTSVTVDVTDDGGNPVTTVAFAATSVGQTATATLHVTDTGTAATGPIALSITGAAANDYSFDNAATTCPAGIAPGASCAIALVFQPTAVGERDATLTIATSAITMTIPLSGPASTPSLSLMPTSVAFGQVEAGHTASATITVHNDGGAAAPLDALAVTGAGFTQGLTTCGGSLAAGASCDIVVQFMPAALGDSPGGLSVMSAGTTYVADLDAHGARRIKVTRTGTGTGTVTSSPAGLACGTTCTGLFEGDVTLTGTPDANNTLGGWSGPCSAGPGGTCIVTAAMSEADVLADFVPIASGATGVAVHFAGGGLGSVMVNSTQCNADCFVPANVGDFMSVEVTAVYGFASISGACSTSDATNPVCTFTQPGGTASVTVTINKDPKETWTRLISGHYESAAYDDSGNLVLVDYIAGTLTKLGPDGATLWSKSISDGQLVATGPADSIYLSGASMTKLDSSGNLLWSKSGGCTTPGCFAVGADGSVATHQNATVTWWSADGMTTWTVHPNTMYADQDVGVTIGHTGVVSVTQNDGSNSHTIIQFAPDGSALPDPGIAVGGYYCTLATTVDNQVAAISSGFGNVYLYDASPMAFMSPTALPNGQDGIATAHSGSADIGWYFHTGTGEPSTVLRTGSSPLTLDYNADDVRSVAIDAAGDLATIGDYPAGTPTITVVQTFSP